MRRGRRLAGRHALLAAACLCAAAGSARGAPDAQPCLARTRVTPPEALVGEQVVYQLELLTTPAVASVDWERPPAFPGARTEWLPGALHPQGETLAGVAYRVRTERRALFPRQVGTLVVRTPDLRCALGAEDAAREVVVAVPTVEVRVRPAPEGGRPLDWNGVTGPLEVGVTVAPESVSLGESVRVGVVLRGEGNVWDAPEPFPDDAAFGGADVFRRRPDEVLEPLRRLTVRHQFAYDLVPRREGTLRIPAVRVPYLDPATRRYAVAEAPAIDVRVLPAADARRPPEDAIGDAEPARAPGEAAPHVDPFLPPWALAFLLCAGIACAGLGGGALVLRRRRRDVGPEAALREARAARAARDRDAEAAALARALRRVLGRHVEGAADLTADEIRERARRPEVIAASRALADVERARFDPRAPPPDAAAVERALGDLGCSLRVSARRVGARGRVIR